jgi:hypothetical protein
LRARREGEARSTNSAHTKQKRDPASSINELDGEILRSQHTLLPRFQSGELFYRNKDAQVSPSGPLSPHCGAGCWATYGAISEPCRSSQPSAASSAAHATHYVPRGPRPSVADGADSLGRWD